MGTKTKEKVKLLFAVVGAVAVLAAGYFFVQMVPFVRGVVDDTNRNHLPPDFKTGVPYHNDSTAITPKQSIDINLEGVSSPTR